MNPIAKVHAGFRPNEIKLRFNIYPSTVIGFFIKLESQKKVGLYNLKYKCSSDYDMFYRIIVKHDMKGFPTTSKEVFGKFELGGFSSQLGFFDHLKEHVPLPANAKRNDRSINVTCEEVFRILKTPKFVEDVPRVS